jgi:hypothetical protein
MNSTFEDLRKEFESMVSNYETFTEKKNNAAGTRTRKHLLQLKKLAHELRKHISDEITARKAGKKSTPKKSTPKKNTPKKNTPNKNEEVEENEEESDEE